MGEGLPSGKTGSTRKLSPPPLILDIKYSFGQGRKWRNSSHWDFEEIRTVGYSLNIQQTVKLIEYWIFVEYSKQRNGSWWEPLRRFNKAIYIKEKSNIREPLRHLLLPVSFFFSSSIGSHYAVSNIQRISNLPYFFPKVSNTPFLHRHLYKREKSDKCSESHYTNFSYPSRFFQSSIRSHYAVFIQTFM